MSTTKLSKSQEKWEAAIADAKGAIQKLKTAILVFEENKEKDEPWPNTTLKATR